MSFWNICGTWRKQPAAGDALHEILALRQGALQSEDALRFDSLLFRSRAAFIQAAGLSRLNDVIVRFEFVKAMNLPARRCSLS
jgi:hypothetical protein